MGNLCFKPSSEETVTIKPGASAPRYGTDTRAPETPTTLSPSARSYQVMDKTPPAALAPPSGDGTATRAADVGPAPAAAAPERKSPSAPLMKLSSKAALSVAGAAPVSAAVPTPAAPESRPMESVPLSRSPPNVKLEMPIPTPADTPAPSAPPSSASGVSVEPSTSASGMRPRKSMMQIAREKQRALDDERRRREAGEVSPRSRHLQRDLGVLTEPVLKKLYSTISFPRGTSGEGLTYFVVEVSPPDGIYRGGKFQFSFEIPAEYNVAPPRVRCLSRILHPNIQDDGAVCLNVLREDWMPSYGLDYVITGLLHLLREPNPMDPLNKQAAEMMRKDPRDFERRARRFSNL